MKIETRHAAWVLGPLTLCALILTACGSGQPTPTPTPTPTPKDEQQEGWCDGDEEESACVAGNVAEFLVGNGQ